VGLGKNELYREEGPWYTYCTMAFSLKKHWPLIGIGLLGVLVGLQLFRAPKSGMEGSTGSDAALEKGLKLEDIHYSQDNPDDRIKWFLDAEEARLSDDRQVISFRKFKLRLEPVNRPRMELEGQRGSFHRGSGEIRLRGGLRGSTEDGYRIVTESAVYNQKKGLLETDDPVRLSGPYFSLEGRGLRLNIEKETLLISSDVTTLIEKGLPVL
jgi:LPS export ABC transporter protein LptC